MLTKLSERNLLISIVIFGIAVFLLFSAKLFNAPVIVSEIGILFIVLGITAVVFAIRIFRKGFVMV
jgi:hypothetical protein